MIRWAGFLITLCGVGHTLGALIQAVPRYADEWFSWALWDEANGDLVEMSHTTAGFWFTVYSFGVPLVLIGLTVLWLGRHNITPPPFIAWTLAAWTIIGEALSGPSPLLLLLVAAVLLLVADHRAKQRDNPATRADSGAVRRTV
jgi:Family of unknown function (DUF6463)